MARLSDPLDALTPDARQVYDKITAKRGAVRGPFASLMHHPALAERVGDLGEYLRFGATLPGDIRELAILIGFWLYALGLPLRYMILRSLRRAAAQADDSTDPGLVSR